MKMGHQSLFKFSIAITALILVSCGGKHEEPNVDLIQDMMEAPSVKAQGVNYLVDRDKSAMRLPPEHTVPRNFEVYKYPNDPLAAEANLKNPYAGDLSPKILEKGRKTFEIYCMVCHGPQGHGDGPVSVKMPVKPPPLISDKVKKFKDGRIFHIITMGQGVMQSYATQIVNPMDRWAVVNYVRSLQKASAGSGKGE